MVKKYRKGYMGERELVHLLSSKGYMVVRTPRSGRICLASPDIIAAKGSKLIVIECKAREEAFTVPQEQIKELQEWVSKTSASAYIAWKISRHGWSFIKLDDVIKNNGNVGKAFADLHSLSIDDL